MAKKKRTSKREYGEFNDQSQKTSAEGIDDEEEEEAAEVEEVFVEDEDDIDIIPSSRSL